MMNISGINTRRELLEAAGALFAEKGYQNTTVREICLLANVNLASISYHFGGKEGLYRAVVLHAFHEIMNRYPIPDGFPAEMTSEERLLQFIRLFLMRRLSDSNPTWHRKILFRELANPSQDLRTQIDLAIQRNYELLSRILKKLIVPSRATESLHLVMTSIIGQCLFFQSERYIIPQIRDHLDLSPEGIDRLARHIKDFSIAAIRGMYPA
jgi:AcrR family transcriptional regulator